MRLGLVVSVVGVLAIAGTTPACGKDETRAPADSPLLHAVDPAGPAPDVARASRDPEALRAALLRPHRAVAAALGAHTLTATSSLRVTEDGTEVEALEITEGFDVAAGGAYHLVHRNSKDYGREVFFVPAGTALPGGDAGAGGVVGDDGRLWLRPGAGKFHRRAPAEPDEAARLLDETFGALAADYDLVAAGAQVSDGGAATVGGRTGRRVKLAVGPARPRREDLPQRAWRTEVSVQALAGELVLDDATGALLEGRLEATLTFVRQGRRFEMRLAATHALSFGAPTAATITPPGDDESVDTPGRSPEQAERDELLRDLAPPTPRARGAAPPAPVTPGPAPAPAPPRDPAPPAVKSP